MDNKNQSPGSKTEPEKKEIKEADRITVTLIRDGRYWDVEGVVCGKCGRPLKATFNHHAAVSTADVKYCPQVIIAEK